MIAIAIHTLVFVIQAVLFIAFYLQCKYGKPNKWTYRGLAVSAAVMAMQLYFIRRLV